MATAPILGAIGGTLLDSAMFRRAPLFGFGFEERARDPRAPPVAQLALAARLGAALAPVGAGAAIDDDGHVGVVLVVLDHLVEELGLELTRDHAVDHGLSVGRHAFSARSTID